MSENDPAHAECFDAIKDVELILLVYEDFEGIIQIE